LSSIAEEPRAGNLYSLLAVVVLIAAPHAQRMPVWVSAFGLALIGWRVLAAQRDWPLPSRWLLAALAIATSAGVILSYGPLLGRDASVALLAVMVALKCMELRSQRDANVVICLGYFLIITNFLYSQSIATAAFMLVALLWLTATSISLQDRARALQPAQVARTAGMLVLQAVPLMLVLFVLFPRVQGPVFGFPQATSTGITGLSESMSPGDLANLGLSDEVAFRVDFHTPAPKPAELYWRGPVLSEFDGRTWRIGSSAASGRAESSQASAAVRYTVTLEPHHMRWLFAVDLPATLPAGASLTPDYQLLAPRPVRVRERYEMTSRLEYRLGAVERPEALQRALRLPRSLNPRARELAQRLRAGAASDREVVQAALAFFRTNLFFYTLTPPPLGLHSVDEFLFQTRRGFCEHYASSFAFLMRAAGVPARVVTGYQGGEINPLGGYLIVRQSEAHAWAEVWLEGTGWTRVDPTAAVSPARIEVGIAAALPRTEPLPLGVRGDYPLVTQLRYTLDSITNSWNQWVLGYTPDRQIRLLSRVGVEAPSWKSLTALLVVGAGIVLLALTVMTLQQLRRGDSDPVQHAYRAFCRKLARAGVVRGSSEGPLDFARRACAARPQAAGAVQEITHLYLALRYGGAPPAGARELRSRVRAFRG
jgi:transglutaminase-like putative cysteine protease